MNLKILTGLLIFYLVIIPGASAGIYIVNSTEEGGWNVTSNRTTTDENESVIINWNHTKFEPYVSYLTMDKFNSTYILDENTTSNNNAEINGPIDAVGWRNRSRDFDGSNDYLNITYSSSIDIIDNNDPFALGAWFKIDQNASDTGNNNQILAQENGAGTGRPWLFVSASTDTINTFLGGALMVGSVVVKDQWYFVVLNYNGSLFEMYINGIYEISRTDLTMDEGATGNYFIGVHKTLANYFNGSIDEFMFFSRNLSATEITDLYNNSWYSSGNITTEVRDAGEGKVITNISCSATSQPAGTTVNLYANVSSDNSAFALELVKAGATCDGTNYTVSTPNQKRYYQVISEMKTTVAASAHINKLTMHEEAVDLTAPVITISSPINKTYLYIADIPLRVSSSNTIDTWWYSIDGGSNTTFTPNITLFNQNNGNYYITVWTNLSNGNENSSTIYFSVDYMGELNVTEFAETVWNYTTRNVTGGNTDNYFDKILGGDIMAMPLLLLITMMVSMVAIAEWKNDRWLYLFTTIWPLMMFFYSITNNPFASYTTYKLDMLWLFSTLILTVYMLIRAGMGPWNTVRVRIQKFRF